GRIAIATTPETTCRECVERRYKVLCRRIKTAYANAAIRWGFPSEPETPASQSSPDRSLWVGPSAIKWLADDPARRVKSSPAYRIEGSLVATPTKRRHADWIALAPHLRRQVF